MVLGGLFDHKIEAKKLLQQESHRNANKKLRNKSSNYGPAATICRATFLIFPPANRVYTSRRTRAPVGAIYREHPTKGEMLVWIFCSHRARK